MAGGQRGSPALEHLGRAHDLASAPQALIELEFKIELERLALALQNLL